MKLEKPKVTIAITNFNSQNRIKKALQSAINQAYPNIEVIVYDDASCDNSIHYLSDFEKRYNCIKVIKGKVNKGTGYARSILTENANGKYICFFDDDDYSTPERVETQLILLEKYKKSIDPNTPVFCYASRKKKYFDKTLEFKAPGLKGRPPKGSMIFHKNIRLKSFSNYDFGTGFPTCSFFALTDDVKKIGSFDKTMRRLEDVDFAIRAGFHNSHFIGTPEILIIQNHTTGSHKTQLKNYYYEKYMLDKHKNKLNGPEYNYLRLWLKIRCSWFMKKYFAAFIYFFKITSIDFTKTIKKITISGTKRIIHEIRSKQI